MRYGLAFLALFVVLPEINVWAAPAPPPFAILQIAPPPKGKSAAEQYRKDQREIQTDQDILHRVWNDPESQKLGVIRRFHNFADARPWLVKNVRVTEENGGHHLYFTFQDGTRDEQVALLNAFLRANLDLHEQNRGRNEDFIRMLEDYVRELEKQHQPADYLRTVKIPAFRAYSARCKEFIVVQWAK